MAAEQRQVGRWKRGEQSISDFISAEIIPFHFFDYWPHKKRVKNLIAHPLSNVVYKKLWLS